MHRHSGSIVPCFLVAVDSCRIWSHLEYILVKTIDSYVAQTVLLKCRTKVLSNKLRLCSRPEIHTLPSAVISHRFINRRYSPDIYSFSAPCLHIFGEILRIYLIILGQQRTATVETVFALIVFLILLHPCRRCPCIRYDAISFVVLVLLDCPDVLHQVIEVVVTIFHLRINAARKTFFIAIEREGFQFDISVLFRQRVLAFHREIRCTDLGTAHGEIRTFFAV